MDNEAAPYTTGHLQNLFGWHYETVRRYCKEFADWLSPTATPPPNDHRKFTYDDLKVFALIAEMKKERKTYKDIKLVLRTDQRGVLPELSEDEIKVIHMSRQGAQIYARMQGRIEELEQQLRVIRTETAPDRERVKSLVVEVRVLKEQLDLANDRALAAYAKGIDEGKKSSQPTLDDLVEGITPENRHPETDWGPDVGKEVVPPYDAPKPAADAPPEPAGGQGG